MIAINVVKLISAATVAVVFCGCEGVGGRSVLVEFRNAEGIVGGESVYYAGVKIGITQAPAIVDGRAQVHVKIDRKNLDTIAPGAIFLAKTDPLDPRKTALFVSACSDRQPGQVQPDLFRGASSRLEFVGMCGAERARQLWDEFTK